MTKIRCIIVDTLNGIQDAQYSAESKKPDFDKWRNYGVSIYNFVKDLQHRGFTIFFVLGYEGSGKSYGIKHLAEGEAIWYNADDKNPTWAGGVKIFGTKRNPTKYHVVPIRSYTSITAHIDAVIKKIPDAFVDEPVAFLLGHLEDYKSGRETRQRLKILGNLARNLSIEGLPENVLYSEITMGEGGRLNYYFSTRNNGMNTCRTTEGLFEEDRIPNDFKYILDTLDDHYK